MTHRGRKVYSLEIVGLIYLIVWIFLIVADFKLLEPIYNNAIRKVGTDEVPMPEGEFLNPTIETFNEWADLEIMIQGFSRFDCTSIIANFNTNASSIPMICRTEPNVTNAVVFKLPTEG